MSKSISHCQGKGSLAHNNRTFISKNVDTSRTPDNIVFIRQSIKEAYEACFGKAVERYNEKQKRADRKIKGSYYESVFEHAYCDHVLTSSDKRKSFYEDLVQIGTMNDTPCGSDDAKIATECLTEYMNGFAERNPNMYVFNAVIHLDEATPHLHLDYIPIGHYSRGIDTQNGLAQALKEQGYTGVNAISKWREKERDVLEQICRSKGIEISAPKKSRGYSFAVDEYKEYKDNINQLNSELEPLRKIKDIVDKSNFDSKKLPLGNKYIVSDEELDRLKVQTKSVALIAAENEEHEKSLAEKEKALDELEENLLVRQDKIEVTEIQAVRKLEDAERKYQEQIELNERYNEQKQELFKLRAENNSLDKELTKIKLRLGFEYGDTADSIISDCQKVREENSLATKILSKELELPYTVLRNIPLHEKAEKCIAAFKDKSSAQEKEIAEKDSLIAALKRVQNELTEKLSEMQNALASAVKTVGALVWGNSEYKSELSDKARSLVCAIGDFAVKKLKQQNASELADEVENYTEVDKEIADLVRGVDRNGAEIYR